MNTLEYFLKKSYCYHSGCSRIEKNNNNKKKMYENKYVIDFS